MGVPDGIVTMEGSKDWSFPLQVSKAEGEHLVITASSKRDCSFSLQVTSKSVITEETATVMNGQDSFVVRSSRGAKHKLHWEIDESSVSIVKP